MSSPAPPQAFDALLRPQLDALYRLAYRFTANQADAEDLLQDTLLKVYERKTDLAGVDKLKPWLAQVLFHQFVDNQRKYRRSLVRLLADEQPAALGEDHDVYDRIPSDDPMPDEALGQKEEQNELEQAWRQLSGEHRALLTLFEIEGYSLQELGQLLECPIGTLKSRLHRARTRLRALLGDEAGERKP